VKKCINCCQIYTERVVVVVVGAGVIEVLLTLIVVCSWVFEEEIIASFVAFCMVTVEGSKLVWPTGAVDS
jgi:hypothetical protein